MESKATVFFYISYFIGVFKFSPATEQAEKNLFEEMVRMKHILGIDERKANLIRAFLYNSFMTNSYELRGRRKVKIILDFLQVGG